MGWIAPDDVLPRALRALLRHAAGPATVCVVRDGRGRIRVALGRDAVPDSRKLAEDLTLELGSWFAGPVLDQKGSPAHKRIASELLRAPAAWPSDWPREAEMPDGSRCPVPGWLVGRVVLQSKESWLDTATAKPAATPRVVSFYSFKGGVGRTTTMGCVAARLATVRSLRVVAVDLDLEAPGTGQFLGARGDLGVADHILSHLATGDVGEVAPEPVDGFPGLWVVPAGVLGPGYLEKLARLDFLAVADGARTSPTEEALRNLLRGVAAAVSPDVILLDSRAGLHDLGGLALHRLSHADVLVARANAQAREGMKIVLGAIRRLRPANERDVRLVQTMVPMPFDSDLARPLIDRWKKQMYDVCLETIYEDLQEVPSLDDEVAHSPFLVGERSEFSRTDHLRQVAPELLPHFDQIADMVAPVKAPEDEA